MGISTAVKDSDVSCTVFCKPHGIDVMMFKN
jgi:hypothetical protein